MSEVVELEVDLEQEEIKAATAEEKEVVTEGLAKTTATDRDFIREEVAEGRMTPVQCARKYDVSIQYISKLLKKAGIRFGIRVSEREAAAKALIELKEREARANFAERKLKFAEEHKMSAYGQLRSAFLLEGMRQKKWREAATAPTGAALPTVKDAMTSSRTMALLDQRIRILLDLDNVVDEKELPGIEINYMGDEEIAHARRGPQNDDELAKLDDDIIEESS